MLGATSASAQNPDDDAITDVIRQLFTGMEKGDSALVHAAFAKEVTMVTVTRDKENKPVLVRQNSLEGFLKAVGTPHPEVWHEEIWNIKIQRDGDFAQVWCDYAFYVGKKFSHCGVNAFHLHNGKEGWRIFHLADTRKKEGCIIPEEISRRYNQ